MYTDLREHAASKDLDRFEDVWMDALGDGDLDSTTLDALLDAAEAVLEGCDSHHRVGTLLELLVACVSDETPARVTLRLFWLLLRLFPEERSYLSVFVDSFVQVYPVASPERAFFDAVDVAGASEVGAALQRLDGLLRFREGAYVYHASGWGMGRVLAVDPFLKQVRVDLEEKKDHRIAIDAVDTILECLPNDHFQVLVFEGGDAFRRLREEEPVTLVAKVVDAFGSPLTVKELKARLVPKVVAVRDWTRWWNRTKNSLRETGFYRVSDRAPHRIERLESAVRYADELVKEYYASDWAHGRRVAKQAARKAAGDLREAWGKIRTHLLELARGDDPVVAVDAASILERGETGEDKGVLREVLQRYGVERLAEVFPALPGPEAQRRAAGALADARPDDWQQVAAVLVSGKVDALRDVALGLLERTAPDVAAGIVGGILRAPQASPEAFCHLLQSYVGGSERPALAPLASRRPRELLVALMDLVNHVLHRSSRVERVVVKDMLTRIHAILGRGGGEFFQKGIEGMGREELRSLHERIVAQNEFSPDFKAMALEWIAEHVPEIAEAEVRPPWEESCIFTTAEGLERRRDQLREIMEIKLPENFEDIGRARAFGDLSENAEYTAALERRDQLTRQASTMRDEVDRASVVEVSDEAASVVGLGSRLEAVDKQTGERREYSILGPWDGTPEEGILSYQSPLARALFGKSAGDEVEIDLPGGRLDLRIEKVRSHFA